MVGGTEETHKWLGKTHNSFLVAVGVGIMTCIDRGMIREVKQRGVGGSVCSALSLCVKLCDLLEGRQHQNSAEGADVLEPLPNATQF